MAEMTNRGTRSVSMPQGQDGNSFALRTGRTIALLYLLAVFLLAGFGHTFFSDLTYIVSLRGFSVVEYLAHALEPLNFARDFPGGAYLAGDKSILTNLYVPIQRLTGLPSITLMAGGIWLEVLAVIVGGTILWTTISASESGESSRQDQLMRLFVGGWMVTVLVTGNVLKPNLSNFGVPFFHGQFYGYADALAFVALAAYLRGKWTFVTLALIAAFAVHPIKAIMPGAFIAASVLANIRTDLNARSAIGGACVALFAAYWAVFQLSLGGIDGVPDIPDEQFIAYTRTQQFHWYPTVNGLITFRQDAGLVPFFALLTMALIAGLKAGLPQRTKNAFLAGYAALAVLTASGIYISIDLRSAFLIKLCLIRASEFMVQLSPFLICLAVYQTWRGKEWLWFSIFTGFLLAAMFPNTQPSSFLAYVAAALFLVQCFWHRQPRTTIVLSASIVSLFIVITQWVWWQFPGTANPVLDSSWAVFAVAGCYIAIRIPTAHKLLPFKTLALASAFSAVFFAGAYAWLKNYGALQGDMAFARSFYDAQKWANASTEKTALFMVDPCLNYGWRDFSERSSIGTPREWYMTSWGYVSDLRVFNLGQEIGRTLGMDLNGMLPRRDEDARIQIGSMCEQAKGLYYEKSRVPLRRVHEKFGVNYFVMYKELSDDLVRIYSLKPTYENNHVRIFSAGEYFK